MVTGDAGDRPGSIGVLFRSKRERTGLGAPWVCVRGIRVDGGPIDPAFSVICCMLGVGVGVNPEI